MFIILFYINVLHVIAVFFNKRYKIQIYEKIWNYISLIPHGMFHLLYDNSRLLH